MREVILFDIDDTLIETDVLRILLKEASWRNTELPYGQIVYPEVQDTLEGLSDQYELGILSESTDSSFQKSKLTETGLIAYFVPGLIFIVESKEDEIEKIAKKIGKRHVFIVDDRLEKLAAASQINGWITIHIRRGRYALEDFDYVPDYEITILSEMLALL